MNDPAANLWSAYRELGVRDDLREAHAAVWARLPKPGTWLTGAQRVAVAAETRAARACALCRERKQALSPYGVQGRHDTDSDLDAARVEAVHRISTDPGRLSKRMLDELAAAGINDAGYVELVGVTVATMAIDAFHRAVGFDPLPLPRPEEGSPSEQRPAALVDIGAWVCVLPNRNPVARALYSGALSVPNVARALSLVPEVVRDQLTLLQAEYLPLSAVSSTSNGGRALDRAQMEFIASRVSAVNECFY